MRRRSPSYSPPPRRGRGRSRSPSPRGRYLTRREPPTSLLVRNLPKNCKAEDLRAAFKRFGPLRDVYLPNDYYTKEPRGFGFVQFMNSYEAEDAQYYMNHQLLFGREITVVFAQENRKKPAEMRMKERGRGFSEDNGRSYYPHRGMSRSRSRSRTPPRGHRYSRSPSPYGRREREYSPYDSPGRSSPEGDYHRGRRRERRDSHSRSPRHYETRGDGRRGGRERSYSLSPRNVESKRSTRERSHSPEMKKGRSDHSFERDRAPIDRHSRSPARSSPLPPRREDSRSRSPSED